jgi:DhnA family fructose-bisphosphate aldolase class Ia
VREEPRGSSAGPLGAVILSEVENASRMAAAALSPKIYCGCMQDAEYQRPWRAALEKTQPKLLRREHVA